MKKIKLPLSLRMVRGAVGKRFVIKHYAYGIVQTKFPQMKLIVPSEQQRACRNAFKCAIAAAKKIMDDRKLRLFWMHQLKCTKRLFNSLVRHFMLRTKAEKSLALVQTSRLITDSFKGWGREAVATSLGAIIKEKAVSGKERLRGNAECQSFAERQRSRSVELIS